MNRGKDICNELKALRRRIADENQIPLETEECTYKGECCGTCPRCDDEVRYLEDALSHRLSLGKAATVAGLALGLAVGAGVQAQNVTDAAALKPVAKEISDTIGKVRVTGVVKDSVTNEPEPFVSVTLNKDGKMIAGCATNLNGEFVLEIPRGQYNMIVSAIGFKKYEKKLNITEDLDVGIVQLVPTVKKLDAVIIKSERMVGLIEKDPEKIPSLNFEYESVKVIAK
ncbi:MAG: carboxypeptidase-like regulatory domain-containing protein [Bacteroidales bacterium]|nr:carboxypeptidase-like regulatory domain-containing protein [Bacteroidales bacterium]